MGLGGVIYGQTPRPNPVGAALQQAGTTIAEGYRQGKELQRSKDQQLVTLALQFLPRMADNPSMLQKFTEHPDFGMIMGAFQRTGLGSVFSRDPQTGSYSFNVPADDKTLEQMYVGALKKKMGAGGMTSDDEMAAILSGLEAKSYGGSVARALATEGVKASTQETDPNKIGQADEVAQSLGTFTSAERQDRVIPQLPTNPLSIMLGAKQGQPVTMPSMEKRLIKSGGRDAFLKDRGQKELDRRQSEADAERRTRVNSTRKALLNR